MAIGDSFRNQQNRVGDPLGMVKKVVNLAADNTAIDVTGVALLEITSDNATAANRTFTLNASTLDGHELLIVFTSGSSYRAQLANSGTARLNGQAWEPLQYDTLKLTSMGEKWYEVARTVAGAQALAATSVSLTADNQAVTTQGYRFIQISSDNATATSRTFTLTASLYVGQVLTILYTSASNKAQLVQDSTTKLRSDWYPNQYETMTLVSDGTNWNEVSRSLNAQYEAVTLSADDQAVTTVGRRFITLTSDNATYTNRTFTLAANPMAGAELTLIFISASNRAQLLEDSTTKLSDDWLPAQYDTLHLVSDGTRWIEVARTLGNSASKVASVSLTADDQTVATEGLETIILSSDDATAANRTFVLTASPRVGHVIRLIWNSANEGQLADTGAVKLVTAAWEPTNLYQNITLVSDGTNWIEVSRADPT